MLEAASCRFERGWKPHLPLRFMIRCGRETMKVRVPMVAQTAIQRHEHPLLRAGQVTVCMESAGPDFRPVYLPYTSNLKYLSLMALYLPLPRMALMAALISFFRSPWPLRNATPAPVPKYLGMYSSVPTNW